MIREHYADQLETKTYQEPPKRSEIFVTTSVSNLRILAVDNEQNRPETRKNTNRSQRGLREKTVMLAQTNSLRCSHKRDT